ncbi:MAG TPA: ArsA-related P-loop ATPase [Planctomycetota bacterium]|nr:ArsA-related P-loop ATPase [Planctomycetota bacterium]
MAARVLFVTGKGGTGKSSVAAALAREASARGTRVLLVRMPAGDDGESERLPPSRSRLFPAASLLREKTLDDRHDLEAFLTRVLGLGFVAKRLGESRTFSAVAAAAPGLRDLVSLSAIASEATRRVGLVIVDAPATGHSVPLLTAPARVLELAPIGPVAREVARARELVRSAEAFTALLVTTPEELAIAEVIELRDAVLGAGVASLRTVVNGVWPAYATDDEGDLIESSAPSPDAVVHWRRHRRHEDLVRVLEARVGECSRIGFAFASEDLPPADVAKLLASIGADRS